MVVSLEVRVSLTITGWRPFSGAKYAGNRVEENSRPTHSRWNRSLLRSNNDSQRSASGSWLRRQKLAELTSSTSAAVRRMVDSACVKSDFGWIASSSRRSRNRSRRACARSAGPRSRAVSTSPRRFGSSSRLASTHEMLRPLPVSAARVRSCRCVDCPWPAGSCSRRSTARRNSMRDGWSRMNSNGEPMTSFSCSPVIDSRAALA